MDIKVWEQVYNESAVNLLVLLVSVCVPLGLVLLNATASVVLSHPVVSIFPRPCQS